MTAIIVKGRPVSTNSKNRNNKNRWKNQVSAEAQKVYAAPLDDMDLSIRITFFYEALPDFDTDNISKPICDALTGFVYHDDNQLVERHAYQRDINGSYTLEGVEPKVIDAIADGEEFVCITIKKANLGVVEI